jgi:NADH-quinone oxidoreductase subunit M
VFAGLTIILGAVYMLRMFQRIMLGNVSDATSAFQDLLWNEKLVLGVIVLAIIVTGIYPKPILDLSKPALEIILNKATIK